MKRWTGYVEALMNRPVQKCFSDITSAYVKLDIKSKKPSEEEIRKSKKFVLRVRKSSFCHIASMQ